MMTAGRSPAPFSPEDMKRRRGRSVALALVLLAAVVIIFITFYLQAGGAHK